MAMGKKYTTGELSLLAFLAKMKVSVGFSDDFKRALVSLGSAKKNASVDEAIAWAKSKRTK
jgi:hypothetical protein